MQATTIPALRDKPRLRGVSHAVAFWIASVASLLLVRSCPDPRTMIAAAVFGMSLAVQLGVSTLYHRVQWNDGARRRMRRLDHAAIFVLIAGGYTPLLALVPSTDGGHRALALVWIGAGVGIVKSLLWAHAPKWVTALVCVGVGWSAVAPVVERVAAVGPLCIGVLVASGLVYSAGAVVYALRRPDPVPHVFGYHEVFHALVVVAGALLFTHVVLVIGATVG